MFLTRVCAAFTKYKIPYAIVGGHAVALHGAIRGTIDIDFIIKHNEKNFKEAEAALKSLGLVSRLPVTGREVFNFREEYIKNRHLVTWSFHNPENPMEMVDIIITHDLGKLATVPLKIRQETVHILNRLDLIQMKRASGRPQDLEDIKALERLP